MSNTQATLWASAEGHWVLTLYDVQSAAVTHYHIALAAPREAAVYSLSKVSDEASRPVYRVSTLEKRCSCRGWQQHSHCKHVDALASLGEKGELDALQPKTTTGQSDLFNAGPYGEGR
jgi:hypothetical protein